MSLKHDWRFVDSAGFELEALSWGVDEKAAFRAADLRGLDRWASDAAGARCEILSCGHAGLFASGRDWRGQPIELRQAILTLGYITSPIMPSVSCSLRRAAGSATPGFSPHSLAP